MFMGEYYYSLDPKGRLSIPSRFRQILEEKKENRLVITRGMDKCLFIFPGYEWQIWENKIRSLPVTQSSTRSFVRIMLGGACESILNKQGRILISYSLRKYAEIDKEVVIIGISNRIEIWDKNHWEQYVANSEKSLEKISEDLGNFGF
ncbi:MAG: division/cell wall cluster transcriptional repressor MraZ [Candidatus Firestonebacteria bacterium]|nr:division/cell wall cluster transcriptional repressor MraZ [Candidatus Firestonebacteria bacterium]